MRKEEFKFHINKAVQANTAHKFGGNYMLPSPLPLAPIPPTLQRFKIEGSRLEYYETARAIDSDRFAVGGRIPQKIMLPRVDEIGTRFVDEMLPLSFTSELIDYNSRRSGMLAQRTDTDSGTLGWSFDILKLFKGSSGGEVSLEYQKQLSAASSYWLGQQENKARIVDEQRIIDGKYRLQISAVTYENNGLKIVGMKEALGFIALFNGYIYEGITTYFKEALIMRGGR